MAELRKTHSNYTLRKKRQLTTKGGIYERDWMTVSELDGFAPGTLPVYASGNFKLTINADRAGKKKYSFSNWALNEEGDEEWTLNVIREEMYKTKSELIKPNYTSILDFAYYGSAVELVRGTVNDVYLKYPGELYLTNRDLQYPGNGGFATITNVVENPFAIDVYSSYVNESQVQNKYRYMYLSWDKYEVVNEETGEVANILEWRPGQRAGAPCVNGDPVFTDARIYIDRFCDPGEGGGTTGRKTGQLIDANNAIIPLGNDSVFYYPALQAVNRFVHEYNNPQGNIHGSVINQNEANIPLGNDSGSEGRVDEETGFLVGYDRRLLHVYRDVHEYGYEDSSLDNKEQTELIPFVELEPKNAEDCDYISFDGIYVNGNVYLRYNQTAYTGWHIRLKQQYIDEAFDTFDDFEKVLLDRDTKPSKYRAKFYTPKMTDKGVITHERSYTWPTLLGGWNLDLIGQTYESYIEGLLYIASYYDSCRSDNIWRSYTHESIKNFDWTTPKDTYVPEIDGELIDMERIESILKVAGRQFDDIKRYIENIKFTVNVSYDSKNNMPDIALGKFLEMSGWEVKNVSPIQDNSVFYEGEYPGKTVRFTPEETNNEFLKRMILNSRNILSKKGTRAGIEAMYSMFGIYDFRNEEEISGITAGFTIEEYDAFADHYIYGDNFDKVLDANVEKNTYASQFERTDNDFCGLMAAYKFDIDGIQYLVPWYDIDETYDGYAYYQMMGGWGKRQWKKIILDLAPNIAEIESDSEFSIFDETVKNIKVVESFKELNQTPIGFLSDGDIYYVLNLTYEGCTNDTGNTHFVYFVTGNTGDVSYSSENGWMLVKYSDFEGPASGLSWFAKKILYMESIHDCSIGNNPHDGHGIYDGGKKYFEYYNTLFKGAFDDNLFDNYRDRIATENAKRHYDNKFRTQKLPDITDNTALVSGIGFNVGELVLDNEKVWYFTDYDNGLYVPYEDYDGKTLHTRLFGDTSWSSVTFSSFELAYDDVEFQNKPIIDTGSTITITGGTLDIPEEPRQYYEGGQYGADYIQGYSVINTKNVKIKYRLPWALQDYVTETVEFYVKQLIPSTVIVEFEWDIDYCNQWGERPEAKRPDSKLRLSPVYQRLRSHETQGEIDITSVNVRDIQIEHEEITTN